ncbi:hypothetical protein CLOM_g23560 [Closterium sp. NIES-68]|nr:hypothetical protein CLOM_g23560 [Closterium sp. NIES-68]
MERLIHFNSIPNTTCEWCAATGVVIISAKPPPSEPSGKAWNGKAGKDKARNGKVGNVTECKKVSVAGLPADDLAHMISASALEQQEGLEAPQRQDLPADDSATDDLAAADDLTADDLANMISAPALEQQDGEVEEGGATAEASEVTGGALSALSGLGADDLAHSISRDLLQGEGFTEGVGDYNEDDSMMFVDGGMEAVAEAAAAAAAGGAGEGEGGVEGGTVQPAVLPLTLRLMAQVPVFVHTMGGGKQLMDVGARVYIG